MVSRKLQIENYPDYFIFEDGRVLSFRQDKINGKFLSHTKGPKGRYLGLWLCNDSGKKRHYIHRLVAEAFCDKPDGAIEVNHLDGNKLNNLASNLEWCTPSQNIQHRFHVLGCKSNEGENNPNNKYGNTIRQKIIDMYNAGISPAIIDKELGVRPGNTSKYMYMIRKKQEV